MKNLSVLIVDDDADFAEGLVDALESQGHRAYPWTTPDDPATCPRAQVDLMFVDINLGQQTGVDLLEKLFEVFPGTPALLMTAVASEEVITLGRRAGALGVIHKPFSAHTLADGLERAATTGTIVIIDDDVDFGSAVEEILVDHGYAAHAFGNPARAFERLKTTGADLLILDVRLPGSNPAEIFDRARSILPELPVVAVTAYPDQENEAIGKLKRLALNGFLKKPVDGPDILVEVGRILAQFRQTATPGARTNDS